MLLDNYFNNVITSDETTKNKPDPVSYNGLLGKLDMNPKKTTIIEDSVHGMRAARFCGAIIIGHAGSLPEEDMPNPDLIIHSFSELLEHLSY